LVLGLGLLALGSLDRPEPPAAPPPFRLTAEQTQWLATHPELRLACDPEWPPFSFGEGTGRMTGLDVELVRLVEQRLGRAFRRIAVANWADAYRRGQAREVDLLSGVARTPERERDFIFTEPYLEQSFGIITRSDAPFLATVGQLGGRRVAVVPEYAVTARLKADQPAAIPVYARTMEEALQLVATGQADATLTDLVNASFLIKTRGLTNLKIAGIAGYRFELRFAVRRDWPELAAILDSAIASLHGADRQAVLDHWVRVDYSDMARWGTVWRLLALTAGGGLIVVTGMLWLNRRLRRELEERRRIEQALRAARDHLSALNQDKTQLLHMAAHDLRNPLTGLLLSLDLLDTDHAAERRRSLGEVRLLARHMVQLINDLLDAQALEDGHRVFRPEQVDFAVLLRETVADNLWITSRKRIVLEVETPARCLVHADRSALRQITDNLLSNAIKFSPAGARVRLAVCRTGNVVRLEVRDEGPGISPDSARRLFTKYGRLDARPTGGESSVGLGLAIVRQLVDAIPGRIWCESELGRGATFVVEIPVRVESPATEEARSLLV
jgi:signal transduction histidine kinase